MRSVLPHATIARLLINKNRKALARVGGCRRPAFFTIMPDVLLMPLQWDPAEDLQPRMGGRRGSEGCALEDYGLRNLDSSHQLMYAWKCC
jgi:hypothetical protein